jgi:hypothetical protein
MSRNVSATVDSPSGTPRECLRVDFHGLGDVPDVHAVTDAGGVFVATLDSGAYLIPWSNAFTVNGQDYPAGTTFRLIVPEGEGPIALTCSAVEIIDLSPPAMMARLAALETRVAALEGAT